MSDDEEDVTERHWIEGNRAAWRAMLQKAAGELVGDGVARESAEVRAAALLVERDAVRASLRALCETHGDNDWPDDLHLVDVIEKHLACYLEQDERDLPT